jgi:hypothetical protein
MATVLVFKAFQKLQNSKGILFFNLNLTPYLVAGKNNILSSGIKFIGLNLKKICLNSETILYGDCNAWICGCGIILF